MGHYRRKTHKKKDAQILNERNLKSIVKEELASFSENDWEDEHPNYKIEVKLEEPRICMICGKFEHGGGMSMDKMFKCVECRRDFERVEENLDYESVSNAVDTILGTKLLVESKVKIVNYNDTLDIAMKVLKKIE